MNMQNELCTLEQIYNFLLMRPYFHKNTQFEKLKEFFYEIHEMNGGFFLKLKILIAFWGHLTVSKRS
jgi:hypothetical protein